MMYQKRGQWNYRISFGISSFGRPGEWCLQDLMNLTLLLFLIGTIFCWWGYLRCDVKCLLPWSDDEFWFLGTIFVRLAFRLDDCRLLWSWYFLEMFSRKNPRQKQTTSFPPTQPSDFQWGIFFSCWLSPKLNIGLVFLTQHNSFLITCSPFLKLWSWNPPFCFSHSEHVRWQTVYFPRS